MVKTKKGGGGLFEWKSSFYFYEGQGRQNNILVYNEVRIVFCIDTIFPIIILFDCVDSYIYKYYAITFEKKKRRLTLSSFFLTSRKKKKKNQTCLFSNQFLLKIFLNTIAQTFEIPLHEKKKKKGEILARPSNSIRLTILETRYGKLEITTASGCYQDSATLRSWIFSSLWITKLDWNPLYIYDSNVSLDYPSLLGHNRNDEFIGYKCVSVRE